MSNNKMVTKSCYGGPAEALRGAETDGMRWTGRTGRTTGVWRRWAGRRWMELAWSTDPWNNL